MIELEGLPELVDPVMIAAFEGWNDAGDAATGAVDAPERTGRRTSSAALDPEDYYDFQVNRPLSRIGDDGVRARSPGRPRGSPWPVRPTADRDVVLVRGIEPNMRWRAFSAELLAVADELGVELVVIARRAARRLPAHPAGPGDRRRRRPGAGRSGSDLEPVALRGPDRHRRRAAGRVRAGRAARGVGLGRGAALRRAAALPEGDARAARAGSRTCSTSPIPLGDLPEDARAWERGVDELAAEDTEVAEYVRTLEEAKDTAELPEATGDAIAREFERYLKRRNKKPTLRTSHPLSGGHSTVA